MEPYLFVGTVMPERAVLSFDDALEFQHLSSGRTVKAAISVLNNQVAVRVETEDDWDLHELRNVVKNILRDRLAVIGFVRGCAYELDVTRVMSRERGVNYVFGIDIPYLSERGRSVGLEERVNKVIAKMKGLNGAYLSRCFADLASAMKYADTGFYCYRAIESLRHHCANVHGLADADGSEQWQRFRQVTGCTEARVREIEAASTRLRNGEPSSVTSGERRTLFAGTWDIVEAYLKAL